MASEEGGSPGAGKCPVYFCGTPRTSTGFDTFYSNVLKISTINSIQITALGQVGAQTKDLEHGVLILQLANKSDLVNALNTMLAFKKRSERGTIRVLAFNLLDNEKISSVLKSKGCAETFTEGLTQKALVHKLQKHVQIVNTKHKLQRKAGDSESAQPKSAAAKKAAAERSNAENAKLNFVTALVEANDCWLVKNKKDFKYIRGNWIGELIGPGPSVGGWVEAGGTTALTIYRWNPRKKTEEPDVFVPGPGSWFFQGRKPEFDWKVNRWRFVGEIPSLFFKTPEAPKEALGVFRFRSQAAGELDVALNSAAAKSKLKAIIETFDDEKVIKDDKNKKKLTEKEITLEREKRKAKGADYDGDISPDEDAKEWGELEEGEDEEKAWGDRSKEGKDKKKGEWGDLEESEDEERQWGDRSDEGEEEEERDWSGLDVGKGNKFNSGRGMGQGDGGSKGYKYDEEKDAFNDRTGEGEEEKEHDWTGLEVGRGNKFTSGRGMGQGQGGEKGYKYDKDKKGARKARGAGELGDEDIDTDEDLEGDEGDEDDLDLDGEADGGDLDLDGGEDGNLTMDGELDEILGEPSEDSEWDTGARAFEKITLEITVSRLDAPGTPSLGDVTLIERQGSDLLLDAPASTFKQGERVSFAVVLGNAGDKKKLQLTGLLKTTEAAGDDREIILVGVTEISRPHLTEIENVFEQRQAQLLKFLREAKG